MEPVEYRALRLAARTALIGLVAILLTPATARAERSCEPVVGGLVSVQGTVEIQAAGASSWEPGVLEERLCEGDSLRIGPRSRAAIALTNEAILRLDENTTVRLVDINPAQNERSFFDLVAGAFQSFSRRPHFLSVNTPFLNATIEGTEFVLRVAEKESAITVIEGKVKAFNSLGEAQVAAGETVAAAAGQAPQRRIEVRPGDAVAWSLYYPPVLAALGGQSAAAPADLPPGLKEAAQAMSRDDVAAAFAALESTPEAARDGRYHLYNASLLLSVGRVEEARAAIERALAGNADRGLALALRSVIAVAQNQQEQALADGREAVSLSPNEPATRIALSYALQSRFALEEARAELLAATAVAPDDALAWGRLAELELMLGNNAASREAALRATELAPQSARGWNALGYAELVEFRTAAAREAFAKAIERDSADPLSRLGQGLAMIREGNLEEGRRDIEVAVGLDPNDALLRSYLGKAYYEEKRDPLDGEQFVVAKQLDPMDPTPYLYDALRLRSENQPGGALLELQKSIERNDNRAIYRGRLALDSDRAARGTSLARVYSDLGFDEVGQTEATKSLTLDPGNSSAHRFLSDIYGGFRRHESARVSELYQAQMLQDVNITPVQPSTSDVNLNITAGGGPASAGFNEFTTLFERNGVQLNATGAVGNNDTVEGEAVVSAFHDWFSISAGAFGYSTDGWRPNHDIEHQIYNVFAQAALTPEVNLQFEARHRETEEGDLDFNFNPDDFSPTQQRELEQDLVRLGLRYSPSENSDFLLSGFYTDIEDDLSETFGPFGFQADGGDEGYQLEGAHLFRHERFNTIVGGSHADFDREVDLLFIDPFLGDLAISTDEDITHRHAYGYVNVMYPANVTWTFGLAYDDFEQQPIEVDEVSPKFGVQWNVTEDLLLRGAWFKVVKPFLSSNRTLEPTQVAGFNQLFDDINATESTRWGAGADLRVTDQIFLGGELSWRELEPPFIDFSGGAGSADHEEETHRAYVNWLPIPALALTAEFVYDHFEADPSPFTTLQTTPEELETISFGLSGRYFHPSGFFAGLGATYVEQDVDRSADAVLFGLAEGKDDFIVVDASVGYRFPDRRGLVSLEVKNLFDEEFNYQDDSFREFQDAPSIGPYIPDQQILLRLTFSL